MNRLTILGTVALAAAALTFPAAAATKHMHHHAHDVARPAADAAGAAAGTAGAIGAAPFGVANGYGNYYGAGWNGGRLDQGYSTRNGLVCTPGTWFKGADGQRHLCQ